MRFFFLLLPLLVVVRSDEDCGAVVSEFNECTIQLVLITFLVIETIIFIHNNQHFNFLDVIASPSSYLCQWVGQ